ncbi:MAG: amino acid--tRNA ligase-related protein [Candidatus Anstonellales archaeon]
MNGFQEKKGTEFGTIVKKIEEERGTEKNKYKAYLEIAKKVFKPSAGGDVGVERLVRYLSRRKHIKEVVPFLRVPGENVVL